MAQLTIEIPDELAQKLRPLQEDLSAIIELGLREITPPQRGFYTGVAEFLASGPSPEAIVALRPSLETQERVAELLDKNRAGTLTEAESAELDEYEQLDYFMTLVKARAYRLLKNKSK